MPLLAPPTASPSHTPDAGVGVGGRATRFSPRASGMASTATAAAGPIRLPSISRRRAYDGKPNHRQHSAKLADALALAPWNDGGPGDLPYGSSPAISEVHSPGTRGEFDLMDVEVKVEPHSCPWDHELGGGGEVSGSIFDENEMASIGIEDVHGSMEAAFKNLERSDSVPQFDAVGDAFEADAPFEEDPASDPFSHHAIGHSIGTSIGDDEPDGVADMEAVLAAVWVRPTEKKKVLSAAAVAAAAAAADAVSKASSGPSLSAVSIRFEKSTRDLEGLESLSADRVRAKIATAFGLKATGPRPIVLRTPDGIVVPVTRDLPRGVVLTLSHVDAVSEPAAEMRPWEDAAAVAAARINGSRALQFVQEPPKGSCEWLTCKVIKSGEARPLQHLFAVEVVVADAAGLGADQLSQRLASAQIRLFTPGLAEKTHLVHQGSRTVSRDAAGRVHVRWDGVGIKEVSSTQSDGEAGGSKLALGRTGGRCAAGWYHMAISAPGIADLWLRSSSTANAGLAKVVVKHKRCYKTGRWEIKRIGPYADHRNCVPSHMDASTGMRLCCEGCGHL